MIAIGGVLGVTIFSTDGEIMHTTGPAGLLTAMAFVALTMIFVMKCLAEFIVMWPVSNAMIEYVKAFLDPDMAIVIGIAYW
jgi:yeast amino acid transporter